MTQQSSFSTGKLPPEVLTRLLARLPNRDSRVVVGPGVGEDAAVIDLGDRYLVAKTDPITFAAERIGWYAVNINANDLATTGAVPKWFLATVLLPEHGTSQALLDHLADDLAEACDALGIAVVGGHTEITFGLDRPLIVGQMLGEVDKASLVTTGGALVGDDLLLTKGIAIEGTAVLAREKRKELELRGIEPTVLDRAAALLTDPGISVAAEAAAACRAGKPNSMHDPTEGGLAAALHEIAAAAGVGLSLNRTAVPVLPECRQICETLGLDPFGTLASGALVLTCASGQTTAIQGAIEALGIDCTVIGRVTPAEEGVRWCDDGRPEPVPLFVKDEVTRVL